MTPASPLVKPPANVVYTVSPTLHPHLGLNIRKPTDGKLGVGKDAEWQLKGITERFKKDMENKQKVVAMNSPEFKGRELRKSASNYIGNSP